jgi:allophanate hydrolase
MVRGERGAAIELEVWEMPATRFGDFVDRIPAPLDIGTVELENRAQVHGFLCEHCAAIDAREIAGPGNWRTYVQQRARSATKSSARIDQLEMEGALDGICTGATI